MERHLRIQLVIGIAVILMGFSVGTYGALHAWDSFTGFGDSDSVKAIIQLQHSVERWQQIGSYIALAGFLYTLGILAIWFIGPPESANSSPDAMAGHPIAEASSG